MRAAGAGYRPNQSVERMFIMFSAMVLYHGSLVLSEVEIREVILLGRVSYGYFTVIQGLEYKLRSIVCGPNKGCFYAVGASV